MTQPPAPVPAPRPTLAARLANTERAPIPAPTEQPALAAPPPPPPPPPGLAAASAPMSLVPTAPGSTELDPSVPAWAAAAPIPVHRLWPPNSYRLLTVAVGFAGVWGLVGSLAASSYLAVLVFLAMLGWAVTAFGFVELSSGQVKQVKLLGRRTATADDVVRIDLVCQRRRNTKWWFPVLTLADGSELPLTVLRSVRRKTLVSQAKIVQAALDGTAFDDSDEPSATTSAPPAPGSPGQIPDDVFTPLEGLEHHYSKGV